MNSVSVELASHRQKTLLHPGWRVSFVPWLRRLLREPLVHFLVLGVALFGIYSWMQRGRGGVEPSRQIALTLDDLQIMERYFESQWHRPPTAAEFQAMVEEKVREEVLYREGLAMGLDKDDDIVKRRMAQKMQFLAEDVAAAHEPSPAELKAWFDKNSNKFALPSRYSFRHLYFSPDKRGKNAREDAASTLANIAGQPEDSRLAAASGDSFMFQDYYGDRTPEAIAKEFGPHLPWPSRSSSLVPGRVRLSPATAGIWYLSIPSFPGRIPALRRDRARRKDGVAERAKATAWQKAYEDMRARYTVLLPDPPDKNTLQLRFPLRKKRYLHRQARGRTSFLPAGRSWTLRVAVTASVAWAHEARPAYLEIKETAPGQFSVLWRTPCSPVCDCQ